MAGLLTGALFGPAQRLLAPPVLAQAAPQASGGLLSMFAPQAAQSPFYRAFDQRRDTITNMLLGGVGAESPLERMRGMAAGVVEGRKSDTSTKQANQTAQWLSQQFGLSPEDAFVAVRNPDVMKFYLKAKGGVDAPASVEEWRHFNSLSPEDQSRYLRMKRASPYLDVGTGFVTPNPVQPGAVDGPAIPKANFEEKFEQARGAEEGKMAGEAPQRRSKALSAMDSLDQQRSIVEGDLDRAIAAIEANPGLVTGLVGGIFSAVPGTPAYALAQQLMTIKANIGFDKLQSMRENSPTGGALGQVSDFENRQLQSVFGSLEQANRPDELLFNLRRLQEILAQSKDARRRAFARDFGETLPAAPVQAPSGGGVVDYQDFFKD